MRRLEFVDDGGFPAVVEAQAEHVHLFLEAQPSCQLVKQPHLAATIRTLQQRLASLCEFRTETFACGGNRLLLFSRLITGDSGSFRSELVESGHSAEPII